MSKCLFFNNVAPLILIKKMFLHLCHPVNFAKYLRRLFHRKSWRDYLWLYFSLHQSVLMWRISQVSVGNRQQNTVMCQTLSSQMFSWLLQWIYQIRIPLTSVYIHVIKRMLLTDLFSAQELSLMVKMLIGQVPSWIQLVYKIRKSLLRLSQGNRLKYEI